MKLAGDPLPTYRAPMRARSREVGKYEAAVLGVERSVVGIGEPLSRPPASLEEAVALSQDEHGAKAGRMLARFGNLPADTLVWTRTGDGIYRLGKLTGEGWRYDGSGDALRTGVCQLRPTEWLEETFNDMTVPDAVAFTFGRGGRNFQRTRHTEPESTRLWRELAD